ncbi:Aldo-keto reductase family 1 member [Wickerhamomyces ciferrii]|uniref:Aldo-keto reductase family 1 member n=1 Tax=Wickerhamomyces ciferrii (strain ATCC 14091 / BCRC 22168 / CBS 111 / JCM 3599 / NBRC 0793 / NRRL Y-1031 F-60-10) TaxID=1206466 RepID=K0KGW0_WICCF|nr:Aldo-keto reductase family 1 member [Wickerhamomyces ciferrii]CCH44420.1 Aldo-keto reductase family 1 member [Wickerhamomyces ciferrii]
MSLGKATDVYLTLNNGNKIPALGLGTANYGDGIPATIDAVKIAIKAGYRHIDTAWIYNTENEIGIALKELFEQGIVKREDLFITTKVGNPLSQNPELSLNQSLEKLGIEYVDLLLQHWPYGNEPVYNEDGSLNREKSIANGTNPDKIDKDYVGAYKKIEKLYKQYPEKIKNIGVSNYSNEFLGNLINQVEVKPVINQIELHPHLPQRDVVEFDAKHDVLITAYSPAGSSGAANIHIPLVKELASKYNTTVNAVLTSYHIQEGRIVIPKSINEQRIKDATVLVPLTKDELQQLHEFGESNPKRFIAPDLGKTIGFKIWDQSSSVINF